MDKALAMLVELVTRDKISWIEAVRKVNEVLGPDPVTGEYLYAVVFRP